MAVAVAGCLPRITAWHPAIPQGGRVNSIAVRPTNPQCILVASETGGLFATTDGGAHFTHVDTLPSFDVDDVAWSPDGTVALATALADFHRGNGPIWRSTDAGVTWSQPESARPPAGPRCSDHPSGYGLSFAPDGSAVYAGTDCGLAVSSDLGVTWNHTVAALADSPALVNDTLTQNAVWAVHAEAGGQVNASAADGLWVRLDATRAWEKANLRASRGTDPFIHAFAVSPYNPKHLAFTFHDYVDIGLYLSGDGGKTWVSEQIPFFGARPMFVRIAKAPGNCIGLYLGNGYTIYQRTYNPGPEGMVAVGGWTELVLDHWDPSDIGFDTTGNPVIAGSDGGVHFFNGTKWALPANSRDNGYTALQINDLAGQVVTNADGSKHDDLYFGTQDNSVLTSSDGGTSWPNYMGGEGCCLTTGATSVDHAGAEVTALIYGGGCDNWSSKQHLDFQSPWRDPPGFRDEKGDARNCFHANTPMFLQPGSYIEAVYDPLRNLYTVSLTRTSGADWTPKYQLSVEPEGQPFVAGTVDNPVIYHVVRRPGTTADGRGRYGLVKVTGLYTNNVMVADADGAGDARIGSIGLREGYKGYPAFAADVANPNHVLAADVDRDGLIESFDGGASWNLNAAATTLLGDGETSRLHMGEISLIRTIGFDPTNSCHVLLGTRHGVVHSTDSGATWGRIAGTMPMGYITSIYFPVSAGSLTTYVSSYGSGLWRLDLERTFTCSPRTAARAAAPRSSSTIRDAATGTTREFKDFGDLCPSCRYLVAAHGAISDVELRGRHVQRVLLSGGTLHQIDAGKHEEPLAVPNGYRRGTRSALARDGVPIRGLVVDGDELKAVITAAGDLPFEPARTPYLHVLVAEGAITIAGRGFAPGAPVRVRVDGEVVAEAAAVDAQGRFKVDAPGRRSAGMHRAEAEQQDGKRLTVEAAPFAVARTEEKRPAQRK
jgi:hypothetical protein